jgi:hypothetical protein
MRTLNIIAALTVASVMSLSTVQAAQVSITVPDGWSMGETHNLTGKKASTCTGRLVVDKKSPSCTKIPARFAGGPEGLNCPNVCVTR